MADSERPILDPRDLRAFAGRDWQRVERLTRRARALQSTDAKVRMAIELYEAARNTRPGWPTDADRRSDLEHHLRICRLLRQASNVGAR